MVNERVAQTNKKGYYHIMNEKELLEAISLLIGYLTENDAEEVESSAVEAGLYELRDLL